MKKTLAWAGQSDVPLKECVAQTRERWTMNTHVRSRVRQVGQWPPLEILFKGGLGVCAKVERTFRSLCVGGDYGPLGVAQRGSRAQRLLSAGARTRVHAPALGADVSSKGMEDSHVRCVLSAFGC